MPQSDTNHRCRLSTPIFVFDDHVDYLKAWYGYARRFRMTQALFIKRAGVGTQAYFSDILARRKRLALDHVDGFTRALELTGEAADYYSLLVHKEHAAPGMAREQVLKQLSRLRERHIGTLVADTDSAYFSSWKYPVVREYIVSRGSVASLREIKHAFLHFSMPLAEVRETVEKLIRWKLVEQDAATGAYLPASGSSTLSYSEMPHPVVNDVKRMFIESSVHAMETLPKGERHITMAVRGMSRERFARFCRRIDGLRQEFLAAAADDSPADNVYGLNIQLFPLMSIEREQTAAAPHAGGGTDDRSVPDALEDGGGP
jgi:uncharacterized protein (TIGR02147 family)